jgi:Kef-type K+ transport system membrane component KefB
VPDGSFVVVAIIAVAAPLLRELAPRLLVPAIVLELVGGIFVGPHVLDLAQTTDSVELFAQIGLAALLFLAGREIQVSKLRGRVLERSLAGFAISFLVAVAISVLLHDVGLVKTPLLVAVILVATSLSVIIVPLRDAGQTNTPFGQQVIAAAAIAEFGAVILLSFLFSADRAGPETELLHLGAFLLVSVLIFALIVQGRRSDRLRGAIDRLKGGSAQIQTRADLALVAIVVAIAADLGLEAILAAFTVGVIRGMTSDPDEIADSKLEAVALGIFVPFFFVASGIDFRLDELFASFEAVARLPLFVVALLGVHLAGALVYRQSMGSRRAYAAGLLQATSFSFVIVATQIGLDLEIMVPATATALVGAGLVSVVVFPAVAFALLGDRVSGR